VAQFVQSQIQETLPGIHLELQPVPDKIWWDELVKGVYGFEITWVWGEYPDAGAYLMMYDSKTSLNYSAYGNAEYDQLIHDADKLPLAADEQGRIEALVRAEQIILDEDLALIPLFQSAQGFLTNPLLDVPFADGQWVVEGIRYNN
jgi:oligopeptide transport system substrate-binding protein